MQVINQWLMAIQKLVIQYKSWLIWTLVAAEIALFLVWVTGIGLFLTTPSWRPVIYQLGKKFGEIALLLYFSTLLPGMISRLRWFPLVGTILMPFRRHLGILMFMCAVVHFNWTTTLFIVISDLPPYLDNAQVAGLGALAVLFPLWLTSNDVSQKKLGKYWKMLHRFTYVAVCLIFTHLVLYQKSWLWPTAIIMGLEALSWIMAWQRTKKAVNPAPASVKPVETE